MKNILFLYLLCITGCSVHPIVNPATGKVSTVYKINKAIIDSGLETNIGIQVMEAQSGRIIYDLNSHNLFNPASNNKIFTATAALKFLTPDFHFITTIWVPKSEIFSSHLSRLVIKGDGDPDFFPEHLDSLAQVLAMYYSSIDTIIIDNTKLDSIYYGEGWMWDEGSGWYAAQIDAMTFNDNCVDLHVTGGAIDEKPQIVVAPDTKYVTINNQAVTVNDTLDPIDFEIERHWWQFNNRIDITGEFYMPEPDTSVYYRNVHDPALFTGTVLKEMLEAKGITIAGPIVKSRVRRNDIVIASHDAGRFMESLKNFLKVSDNQSGELYVKTIGQTVTGNPGSWHDGLHAIRLFFQDEIRMDTTTFSYVDGSGVSRYNYSSPSTFTQILQWIYLQDAYRDSFITALPTGGWDGTLKSRMTGDDSGKYIHAKTGTLSGVSCLSGYILPPARKALIFSILMNGYVGDAGPYRDLQDEICRILIKN